MNEPLPIVVANLKANKTWDEVALWIDDVAKTATSFTGTIIFCPSHSFLASAFAKIAQNSINLKLGSQDISRFEQGAYTGEVAASQIADLCQYAIVGHSERRKFFGEEPAAVNEKIALCQKYGITPIVCVSRKDEVARLVFDHSQTIFLAFEPLGAIGSKHPESLPTVTDFFNEIQSQVGTNVGFLYGGSVDEEDASSFTGSPLINGLLIGGASLGVQSFINIIQKS